ncbi:DUF2322 family protein [Aquabacterium sp. A3]|uniref:DUF2322 family protein n=1 Tax=Aquabacterium sp. A3 TaxID=3132829 RepID=UPI00311A5DDA
MAFADNLKNLPSAAHLAAIDLLDAAGECVATIENKPGQAGSLTLYAAMAAKHGAITPAAAQEALALYAEHTEDARLHPGKHPNIDRLLTLLAQGQTLSVRQHAA